MMVNNSFNGLMYFRESFMLFLMPPFCVFIFGDPSIETQNISMTPINYLPAPTLH